MDLKPKAQNIEKNISIIIPVLNEAGNIKTLIAEIRTLSHGRHASNIMEVIFVDDGSTDGTVDSIRNAINQKVAPTIRILERKAKDGTVNAQLYGISAAENDSIVIMDGDLQHPVSYVEKLIDEYFKGYDLVLASRYVPGGMAKRSSIHGIISRGANYISKFMLPWVSDIQDPISGFFIVNRKIVPYTFVVHGFNKLALYILTCKKDIQVSEIPFIFEERKRGVSKVSSGGFGFMVKYVGEIRFYRHLREIITGKKIPHPSTSEYTLLRQV